MYLAELVDFEKMDKAQVVELCIVLFELLSNKQAVPVAYPINSPAPVPYVPPVYPTIQPPTIQPQWLNQPTVICGNTSDSMQVQSFNEQTNQ